MPTALLALALHCNQLVAHGTRHEDASHAISEQLIRVAEDGVAALAEQRHDGVDRALSVAVEDAQVADAEVGLLNDQLSAGLDAAAIQCRERLRRRAVAADEPADAMGHGRVRLGRRAHGGGGRTKPACLGLGKADAARVVQDLVEEVENRVGGRAPPTSRVVRPLDALHLDA
eukprot:3311953-Pleurochrysis_carterae.AAC.9